MIQYGLASFSVLSTETDPALITEILGVHPTHVRLRGEVSRSGRVRQHNAWSLLVKAANSESDQTGTGALSELMARTRAAVGRVPDLPPDCYAKISWSATSDSTQGGFVLPSELAASIAALGVDLYATVYVDADSDTDA